ncbi:MAG: hypothetical protein IBJ03_07320 [Gemmatimonadaceae bacterium]|nr:hypothetical protein [Gemmatimonadaceae bacterium]
MSQRLLNARRIARHRAPGIARRLVRPRRGMALLTVIVLGIVAMTIALASSMLVMGSTVTTKASERTAVVDDAALTGLEEARNRLNARLDTVPAAGMITLEDNVVIAGTHGVKRSTWASRVGNSDSLSNAGEFGVQAEIVSRAVDQSGTVAIRRAVVFQESFAKYAYFTDIGRTVSNSILWFANGWTASGPMHSNDSLYIRDGTPPQAIFKDVVTTAKGVYNADDAQWDKGRAKIISPIAMPGTADLNIVRDIAQRAGYVFTPTVVTGDSALTTMRIEFVAVDIDGDGNTTGPDEGFFRVYRTRSNNTLGHGYAAARPAPPPSGAYATNNDSVLYSPNCGTTVMSGGQRIIARKFSAIAERSSGANTYVNRMQDKRVAFDSASARCFLGGDPRLNAGGTFAVTDAAGDWMPRTSGTVPAAVASRPDGAYLWPLSPRYNPNFRGTIFVEGRVGLSGTVRGRLTVAARNNIVILDDLKQATTPGNTTCTADDDIVGVFAGEHVLWADNLIQTPQQRRTNDNSGWLLPRKDFSASPASPDLQVHAVIMGLRTIGTERPSPPSGLTEAYYVDRGFVRQVGGRIMSRAGQGGTIASGGTIHGFTSDISFNRCALTFPPPYFPTTQHWRVSQYLEIDPRGFDIANWFAVR